MTKQKEIVVTCSIEDGSVARVEKRLRDVGFEIDNILEFTGSIVGRWNKPLKVLRELPEVDAAEESEMSGPQ